MGPVPELVPTAISFPCISSKPRPLLPAVDVISVCVLKVVIWKTCKPLTATCLAHVLALPSAKPSFTSRLGDPVTQPRDFTPTCAENQYMMFISHNSLRFYLTYHGRRGLQAWCGWRFSHFIAFKKTLANASSSRNANVIVPSVLVDGRIDGIEDKAHSLTPYGICLGELEVDLIAMPGVFLTKPDPFGRVKEVFTSESVIDMATIWFNSASPPGGLVFGRGCPPLGLLRGSVGTRFRSSSTPTNA
ncbi:hypothetical protein HD554DRAFT_2041725 [Boletus coccyginus]|nr:hypothetical protein HD554DRAFT_2041725 [Boletus coccyginus]